MEKVYNKLIRDRIPEVIEADGSKGHYEILSDENYTIELKKKLMEESLEAAMVQNREDLIQELADVTEVRNALMKLYDIPEEELEAARLAKLDSKGGFDKKLFLTTVDEVENKGA